MRLPELISLISVGVSLWSCGATLPREVVKHRPVGIETPLNLDEINLSVLQNGAPVTVGTYMRERNLQWLVLTFGSKSCGACMEKARYFQANLVGDYGLLGENARGKIELIGVATDPASSRDELLALVEDENLSHLAWADSGDDKVMMKYFQPAGMPFSVPLTVMLSRDGILWRVSSKDKLTPGEIIQKIAATIGSDAVPLPPSPPAPEDPDGLKLPLLSREVPKRFNEITVKSCVDRRDVNLGHELPPIAGNLRAVLVHKDNCAESADCVDARAALQSWHEQCEQRWGVTCSFKDLVIGGTLCGDEYLFAGGQEFFDVFADHFTWTYRPVEAGAGRIQLPEPKGPWTLVFDSDGRLVFSKEGAISESLSKSMDQNRLTSRARGPEFPVQWEDAPTHKKGRPVNATFSDLRARAKYTVVMFWNTWCSSCTEEIQEWHQEESSAFRFCKAHSDFCQVVALETGRADSGLPPQDYLDGLIRGNDDFEGWLNRGWSMPLAVEVEPYTDGRAPMGWFAGWVRARFGSSEPRTVLYDREGKVVGSWRSLPGEHGPRDALKKLYEGGL